MKHIHAQSLIVHRSTDPTVSDNASRGFAVESEWYNGTTFWKLTSFSGSDAIWERISGGGSGTSLTDIITAGEDLVENDLVYLSTDGKYWKADYINVPTCSTELRLVKDATILANASGGALRVGIQGGFTGLSSGQLYYVGENGAICLYDVIPDIEGIVVRSVGTAKSDTELEFNPDQFYTETTLVANTSDLQIQLGENVGGGKLLYLIGGVAFLFSASNTSLYGKALFVSNTSGLTGDTITVKQIGECNQFGGLVTDTIYYASDNGSVTSTVPTTGIFQPAGVAKNATTLIINISPFSYIKI